MTKVSRRNFIKSSIGIAGTSILSGRKLGFARSAGATKPRVFKYAICNESMKGMAWEDQCQLAAKAGYQGIEIAAFSLVQESVDEITPVRRKEMVKALQKHGLECAGLHWLLAPPPAGLHATTSDSTVYQKTWDYLGKLIDFCGDLGGTVMVFGSPKQRNAAEGVTIAEATKRLADGLAKAADHAAARKVKILIEPLDHTQTNVVNTTAEAMKIVNAINHPAIQTMFDFHNTVDETEPFHVLIQKYYTHIFHVHVQEMDGKYLGTGNAKEKYVRAFQTLKDLKYDKWVSLEVFDFSPGAQTIAVESIKVLRAIEAKLK